MRAPDPSGFPFATLLDGRDSASNPLLGLRPPSQHFPKLCSPSLDQEHLSGFCSLQRTRKRKSTSRRLPGQVLRPVRAGLGRAFPLSPTTVPLLGFLNLSAASSFHFPPAILRRVALLGFLLQGLDPSNVVPSGSSPSACPLDVCPSTWPVSPPSTKRQLRARWPLPRMKRNQHLSSPTGLSTAWKSIPQQDQG